MRIRRRRVGVALTIVRFGIEQAHPSPSLVELQEVQKCNNLKRERLIESNRGNQVYTLFEIPSAH